MELVWLKAVVAYFLGNPRRFTGQEVKRVGSVLGVQVLLGANLGSKRGGIGCRVIKLSDRSSGNETLGERKCSVSNLSQWFCRSVSICSGPDGDISRKNHSKLTECLMIHFPESAGQP
jgi:hypothetical protein